MWGFGGGCGSGSSVGGGVRGCVVCQKWPKNFFKTDEAALSLHRKL